MAPRTLAWPGCLATGFAATTLLLPTSHGGTQGSEPRAGSALPSIPQGASVPQKGQLLRLMELRMAWTQGPRALSRGSSPPPHSLGRPHQPLRHLCVHGAPGLPPRGATPRHSWTPAPSPLCLTGLSTLPLSSCPAVAWGGPTAHSEDSITQRPGPRPLAHGLANALAAGSPNGQGVGLILWQHLCICTSLTPSQRQQSLASDLRRSDPPPRGHAVQLPPQPDLPMELRVSLPAFDPPFSPGPWRTWGR